MEYLAYCAFRFLSKDFELKHYQDQQSLLFCVILYVTLHKEHIILSYHLPSNDPHFRIYNILVNKQLDTNVLVYIMYDTIELQFSLSLHKTP